MIATAEKQYLQIFKKIEGELPNFAQKKHESLLKIMKTLDLFYFMSENQFSNDKEQCKYYVPFISQSIFLNSQRFVEHLERVMISKDKNFPQYAYNFFLYDSNQKYLKYFIHCCFPTLFNQFSSDEFSLCAYKFIKKYIDVEKNPMLENEYEEEEEEEEEEDESMEMEKFNSSGVFSEKSELTSDDLTITYILHNYQFRQNLLETFHKKIFEYDDDSHKDLTYEKEFRLLIQSFISNLSYLDTHQIQILSDFIQSSKSNSISLLKRIFIRLIEIWRYSPQFCCNKVLGEIPDEPAEYPNNKNEEANNENIKSLKDFILQYQYPNENEEDSDKKDKIKEQIDILLSKVDQSQTPHLHQQKLNEIFTFGKVSILLSDYDVFLFSWIIKQGSNRDLIRVNNLIRTHPKQEDFASKESALRLFYVDLDLFSRFFKFINDNEKKDDSKTKNIDELCQTILDKQRKRLSSVTMIEKQIKACQKSFNPIILKYSDSNFLKDSKHGVNLLIEQLKLNTMEVIPQVNSKMADEIAKLYLNYVNSFDTKPQLEDRYQHFFVIINNGIQKNVKNFSLLEENKMNFQLFFQNMDMFIFGQYLISLNRNIKSLPKKIQIQINNDDNITIPDEYNFISNALRTSLLFKNDNDNLFTYSGFRYLTLEELSGYIREYVNNSEDFQNDEKTKNSIITQFIYNGKVDVKCFIDSYFLINNIINSEKRLIFPLKSDGLKFIIDFLNSLNQSH